MKKAIYIATYLSLFLGYQAHAQLTSVQEVPTKELALKRETIKKNVVESYLAIKNSLVVSDSTNAANYALKFANALDEFKFKKLNLNDMNAYIATREEIKNLAFKISKTMNINTQRKTFSDLSQKFWSIADKVKPTETTLYQQVCPMTGDTWLSSYKEIKNPYFPKNMLTCGAIKQSI